MRGHTNIENCSEGQDSKTPAPTVNLWKKSAFFISEFSAERVVLVLRAPTKREKKRGKIKKRCLTHNIFFTMLQTKQKKSTTIYDLTIAWDRLSSSC